MSEYTELENKLIGEVNELKLLVESGDLWRTFFIYTSMGFENLLKEL